MDSYLPNWKFDQIAADDPPRASVLESAPPSDEIAEAVTATFRAALSADRVRIGLEEAESNSNDVRTVLQFHVGAKLFDWFFNARTGYRARFRFGWRSGLAYNAVIISALRQQVRLLSGVNLAVRRLNASFEGCGATTVTVDQLSDSLDPHLSKIWFCTLLIQVDGRVTSLPLGLTGPRILLEQGNTWAAPYREDQDAWLDVKGAFFGAAGPYQPKDPVARAKRLQVTGDA